jgi:hypothetical protein
MLSEEEKKVEPIMAYDLLVYQLKSGKHICCIEIINEDRKILSCQHLELPANSDELLQVLNDLISESTKEQLVYSLNGEYPENIIGDDRVGSFILKLEFKITKNKERAGKSEDGKQLFCEKFYCSVFVQGKEDVIANSRLFKTPAENTPATIDHICTEANSFIQGQVDRVLAAG